MSQSREHERLILASKDALVQRYKNLSIMVDIQDRPGDPIPRKIGHFRPDLYATEGTERFIIAEAKTNNDVDNNHTYNQLETYLNYLDEKKNSILILTTNGEMADRAKTILYFIKISQKFKNSKTKMEVFDTMDFWRLDTRGGGIKWHLL